MGRPAPSSPTGSGAARSARAAARGPSRPTPERCRAQARDPSCRRDGAGEFRWRAPVSAAAQHAGTSLHCDHRSRQAQLAQLQALSGPAQSSIDAGLLEREQVGNAALLQHVEQRAGAAMQADKRVLGHDIGPHEHAQDAAQRPQKWCDRARAGASFFRFLAFALADLRIERSLVQPRQPHWSGHGPCPACRPGHRIPCLRLSSAVLPARARCLPQPAIASAANHPSHPDRAHCGPPGSTSHGV